MLSVIDLATAEAIRTGDSSWLKHLRQVEKYIENTDAFEPFVNSTVNLKEVTSFMNILAIKEGVRHEKKIYLKPLGCNIIPIETSHLREKLKEVNYLISLRNQWQDGQIKFYFEK